MKQKDIALIIVIASISAVVSFFVSNKLFVTPTNRQQKVPVVSPITPSFNSLNKKYFNENSIDSAQDSTLGGDSNQNPFNGSN